MDDQMMKRAQSPSLDKSKLKMYNDIPLKDTYMQLFTKKLQVRANKILLQSEINKIIERSSDYGAQIYSCAFIDWIDTIDLRDIKEYEASQIFLYSSRIQISDIFMLKDYIKQLMDRKGNKVNIIGLISILYHNVEDHNHNYQEVIREILADSNSIVRISVMALISKILNDKFSPLEYSEYLLEYIRYLQQAIRTNVFFDLQFPDQFFKREIHLEISKYPLNQKIDIFNSIMNTFIFTCKQKLYGPQRTETICSLLVSNLIPLEVKLKFKESLLEIIDVFSASDLHSIEILSKIYGNVIYEHCSTYYLHTRDLVSLSRVPRNHEILKYNQEEIYKLAMELLSSTSLNLISKHYFHLIKNRPKDLDLIREQVYQMPSLLKNKSFLKKLISKTPPPSTDTDLLLTHSTIEWNQTYQSEPFQVQVSLINRIDNFEIFKNWYISTVDNDYYLLSWLETPDSFRYQSQEKKSFVLSNISFSFLKSNIENVVQYLIEDNNSNIPDSIWEKFEDEFRFSQHKTTFRYISYINTLHTIEKYCGSKIIIGNLLDIYLQRLLIILENTPNQPYEQRVSNDSLDKIASLVEKCPSVFKNLLDNQGTSTFETTESFLWVLGIYERLDKSLQNQFQSDLIYRFQLHNERNQFYKLYEYDVFNLFVEYTKRSLQTPQHHLEFYKTISVTFNAKTNQNIEQFLNYKFQLPEQSNNYKNSVILPDIIVKHIVEYFVQSTIVGNDEGKKLKFCRIYFCGLVCKKFMDWVLNYYVISKGISIDPPNRWFISHCRNWDFEDFSMVSLNDIDRVTDQTRSLTIHSNHIAGPHQYHHDIKFPNLRKLSIIYYKLGKDIGVHQFLCDHVLKNSENIVKLSLKSYRLPNLSNNDSKALQGFIQEILIILLNRTNPVQFIKFTFNTSIKTVLSAIENIKVWLKTYCTVPICIRFKSPSAGSFSYNYTSISEMLLPTTTHSNPNQDAHSVLDLNPFASNLKRIEISTSYEVQNENSEEFKKYLLPILLSTADYNQLTTLKFTKIIELQHLIELLNHLVNSKNNSILTLCIQLDTLPVKEKYLNSSISNFLIEKINLIFSLINQCTSIKKVYLSTKNNQPLLSNYQQHSINLGNFQPNHYQQIFYRK
ncbi:hypothetical protein DLAC_10561 [Tieghemostelium lacteum]|uniref:Uncharacterized protein n=1 Tax=Tieghemostelium lacteum TaxID=361077 RepID=A0A151Z4T4_TIELA|nr:hypothetical protein DLAC_10561 [Tieghemostelium lacteum]|eukprot:KYQ88970.1 hypothetical protein DLAC_10561 [Tieghemostelium lacteum]